MISSIITANKYGKLNWSISDKKAYREFSTADEFIIDMIRKNKSNKPQPVQEKGLMSTSLLKDIVNAKEAYSSEKNLLKIYVDENSIGLYVNSVAFVAEL